MSNISGQLIKDSYNYVLQSDLISGIVYRIGGSVAENPKFISGLTVNANFTYSDGSEFPGYVLTCDAAGNAVWSPVSGATSGVVVTGGTFNYSAGTLTLVLSNGVNVPISGLEDIYVTGGVVSGNSIVFSYNDTNTFEVSGITPYSLFSSYTASTQSTINNKLYTSGFTSYTATTQPLILNSVTGGTFSGGTLYLINNSGTTIPISGFTTGGTSTTDTFVTGFTLSSNTITLSQNRTDSYSSFTISLSAYTGSSVSGAYLPLSGGTLTGGLTANTISATTYLNLPSTSFTGGTVSGPTNFTGGLSANTISATTYYNYPDTYVTGFSLTNNVITLSQNRIDSYSSFTVTLSGLTGTSQQIAYYNASGNLTGDTNFTRLDETNSYTTTINTVNFSNVNEYQQSSYDYDRVRSRIFNDDISLVGVTKLESQSFISKIENTSGGTISSLEILETSGSFRYQDSGGTYNGFFYNDQNPGWNVEKNGVQYTYNLPKSTYLAGGVLTDVSGDGNLTWVVSTNTSFTGGTVSGATRFISGLTANTISATTYQNLPFSGTVNGNGTTNFLPKWTGTTGLGNSQIRDNGTRIGIGSDPLSNYYLLVVDLTTASTESFRVETNSNTKKTISAFGGGTGVYSQVFATTTSVAFEGSVTNGTNAYGFYGLVSPGEEKSITNGIGGYFEVSGTYGYGEPTNKYSLQLLDGTEGLNKVLTSVTSDGKANWETPKTNGSNLYLFYNY
jgi:hypothetical protein